MIYEANILLASSIILTMECGGTCTIFHKRPDSVQVGHVCVCVCVSACVYVSVSVLACVECIISTVDES
jgi:hypothetical protein